MATTSQAPDPKTFKKWEDAFAYPIPAVRRMEQQLRTDITGNRERLRSLVGGSYRDLLGTADAIVDMDGRMHGVESLVARIGRRCNNSLMERTKVQSRQMMVTADARILVTGDKKSGKGDASGTKRKGAELVLASRLAVFKACPDAIVRLLRRRESLLTAAKVLALSRILYKQLSSEEHRFTAVVESALSRIGRIRTTLLEAINLRLGGASAMTAEELIDAMSAYALASIASTADVLRYFHQTRASAMIHHIRRGKNHKQRPVKALKIWLQTLRDTPVVFPRQLSQALNRVKADPLLDSEDVQEMSTLELDIHRPWLGEDVVNFVQYMRHDDLDIAAAKKQISSWAPETFQKYIRELTMFLESSEDLVEVAKMRRDCLTAWFTGNNRIAGIEKSDVLDGLREVFAKKLASMIESRCNALKEVSTHVEATVMDWSDDTAALLAPSLWDETLLETDINHGAGIFTGKLQSSVRGRTRAVEQCLKHYRAWRKGVEDIENTIREQRGIRWQDLGDDFDEDYDEDETRDQLLSKDDPEALQMRLKAAVDAAVKNYQTALQGIAESIEGSADAAQKAAFLLRFLRETTVLASSVYKEAVSAEFIARLHSHLAAPIVVRVIEKNRKRMVALPTRKPLTVRALWSEEYDLPVMPSPWAVKIIRDCHAAMGSTGTDLWTGSSVNALKGSLSSALSDTFAKGLADMEKPEDDEAPATDGYVQQLFDVSYLQAALSERAGAEHAKGSFANYVEELAKLSALSQDKQEKLSQSAAAYWKRTSLLFALLS